MRKTVLKLSLASVLLIASQACNFPRASKQGQPPRGTAAALTSVVLTQTHQPGIPITGAVQVHVSVATNCRTGPGIAYAQLGVLLPGQVADVVGRNSNGTYWVIRNPGRTDQLCWLWGQFAILTGNPAALPVLTPPPPPPPTAVPTSAVILTPLPTSTSGATPAPSPIVTSTP